ncbi:MAG: hypothetical protein P1P90_03485 [Patescibacteria group bacterium]|nr:hypothetical protein [Patescibacteria group bacterium]
MNEKLLNPFKSEPENLIDDPRRKDFLSDEDIETIKDGMEKFWKKYQERSPEELPTAVIFTETSARPFAYLFKPILEKLYSSKGIKPPGLGFILTHQDMDLAIAMHREDFDWESWSQEYISEKTEGLTRRIEGYKVRLRQNDDTQNRESERGSQSQERMKKQIDDLQKDLDSLADKVKNKKEAWELIVSKVKSEAERLIEQGKAPHVLFVDEQVYHGGTIRFLEKAFQEVKKVYSEFEVEFFTFKDAALDKADSGGDFGFRSGLGDRYLVADYSFDEFAFRENDLKSSTIGLTKELGGERVRKSADADQERMHYFRNLLKQIGEEMAEELG